MQNIEKLYKDKLKNHSSPVSDKVWQNIALALEEKNRKRRIFVVYIAVAVLILALILGYFIINNGEKAKQDIKNIPLVEKKSKTVYSTQHNITKTTSPAESNTKHTNNTITYNSSNQRVNPNKPIELSNYSYLNSNTKKIFTNNFNNKTKSVDNNQYPYANFNRESSTNHKTDAVRIINFKKINVGFDNNIYVRHSQFDSDYLFRKKRLGILNDCFPIKRNFFFLEAYFSNDYNSKTLAGDNSELLRNRKNTESNLYSYSFGLLGGYLMSNGVYLKTGINYTSINEKFNVTFRNVVSTQTIITIDTIKNSDGSITEIRDTTIKEIFGERNVQKHNRYTMLDVPLIVGLDYKRFNHKIGISAGIIFNVISMQKGTVLSHIADTDDLYSYTNNNDIFRKNVGISIYAGFAYSYRLLSRYEFFIEPNIRYYLKSFTKENYMLDQNYTKYGISIGTRYIF